MTVECLACGRVLVNELASSTQPNAEGVAAEEQLDATTPPEGWLDLSEPPAGYSVAWSLPVVHGVERPDPMRLLHVVQGEGPYRCFAW